MGDSINDQIQSYAAVAEPSEIIKMLGYTYSASQIGLQLAKIGALMSLNTALPFVQMLSIITGAGLLILTMIVSYCSVAVGVNQQLGLWYAKHINSMEEARQILYQRGYIKMKRCSFHYGVYRIVRWLLAVHEANLLN